MRVAGIIAEYNPFHNGHAHLIARLRSTQGAAATHIVAVMSGNFVQRGEPALLPKEERVKMALAGGVDLVIELPLPYVLTSAEGFAGGAVALLDTLGVVDVLGFGSECGEVAPLKQVAAWLDTPELQQKMRYFLEGGISYAEARQKALRELAGGAAALLDGANNTLAVEYLCAAARQGSDMAAFTVPRLGAGHDAVTPSGSTASASLLRALTAEGRLRSVAPYMPPQAYALLTAAVEAGRAPADAARAERALLYRLRSMSREEFACLPHVSEGLENRLYKAARTATSGEELMTLLRTRRYPDTRLRRLLWAAYTGVTETHRLPQPPYLRVLGLNDRGEEILAAARQNGRYRERGVSLFTRASQEERLSEEGRALFRLECEADDRYDLTLPTPRPCGTDFTAGVIRAE